MIPGASTINFDEISKKRIFEAIDSANMQLKKDLVNDYIVLKAKLGKTPMMMDFIEHGSRDPFLYADYSKSYFNFVASQEKELQDKLDSSQKKLLEVFSNEINNTKRVEECIILIELLKKEKISFPEIKSLIKNSYGYVPSDETIRSAIRNLNFMFVTENKNGSLRPVNEIYNIKNIKLNSDDIFLEPEFKSHLKNNTFFDYLEDSTQYSIHSFNDLFQKDKFMNGFILYRKYSRKDVLRILNWETNQLAQNVGGSILSKDERYFPIFVNYHKEAHISSTTKYEDEFLNKFEFQWMSKSKRTLESRDISILRKKRDLTIPLFIKKSNDEGLDFYFMGNLTSIPENFTQATLNDDNGKPVSVVKVIFSMNTPVDDNLYDYITESFEI